MATVLILGATSDIGRALAKRYAKQGNSIQLAARNPHDLLTLRADLIVRYGIDCHVFAFDAENLDSHPSFWTNFSQIPDISIVVFGIMYDNEMALENTEIILNTIQVNYTGAVSILNIISRTYKERNQGQIVGISSVAGLRGRGSNYIYGSAKAGFTTYLSGLRNELYNSGVHVLTVLPGFVHTKMTAELNLPPILTAQPDDVASSIEKGLIRKKNVVYVKCYWQWIMLIIRLIPERIFKKLKL